jgi:hypothetical protein
MTRSAPGVRASLGLTRSFGGGASDNEPPGGGLEEALARQSARLEALEVAVEELDRIVRRELAPDVLRIVGQDGNSPDDLAAARLRNLIRPSRPFDKRH